MSIEKYVNNSLKNSETNKQKCKIANINKYQDNKNEIRIKRKKWSTNRSAWKRMIMMKGCHIVALLGSPIENIVYTYEAHTHTPIPDTIMTHK